MPTWTTAHRALLETETVLDRLRREDDGFTLVETLAAMIVLAILAVSVASVMLNGFSLTKSNAARVAAANLAAQAIETVRAVPARIVPDGQTTTSRTVNGVVFELQQTATYVEEDSKTSLCTGSGTATGVKLAYKLVTVTVTWPSMGQVQPVRQDTLLSLGVGGLFAGKGIAAIGVVGAGGAPTPGVAVTLSPGGAVLVTGSDGCAIFSGLDPGSYSAAVGQDGFVTPAGTRNTSRTFTVAADAVARVPVAYERVGTLALTLTGPGGLLPPPAIDVTLTSAELTPTQQLFVDCTSVTTSPYSCFSGSPRTGSRLWPAVYDVQVGACPEPTAPVAPVTVQAGQTAAVTLPLAGARAEVRSSTDALVTGYTVYAVRAGGSGCPTQSWPMAPAGASTQSLALPPGTWTFALTPDGSGATTTPWPTAVLTVGGAVPTVVVRLP